MPTPIINGLESEGVWGNANVIPRDRDNGIEDGEWCYWGGNPILDEDGKYYLPVCRWPERTGHNGWLQSEVALCVSDNPLGPYEVISTIVEKGYNPEVIRLANGDFALHAHFAGNNSVYVAEKMTGPWKRIGAIRQDTRGFRKRRDMGSNLTAVHRSDGSILIVKKDGDVAISNSGILGPFRMVSISNYMRTSGYPEDPVIWFSGHQYHCIYNHAEDSRSAYMRSLNGVQWKNEYGLPYDSSSTYYTDGTKNTWDKFERPKVIQDKRGRATHMSLALIDVPKRTDRGNDNHSSKNMIMPLTVEKLISMVNSERITAGTKKITLQIEAEAGFNPQTDLDIDSLRFGSDSVVNLGGGCKAVKTKKSGKNLLIDFEGDCGLTHLDFDFKLLGKDKKGDLVFGYALLPGKSPAEAVLIALPCEMNKTQEKASLECLIENAGLMDSKPRNVLVYKYTHNKRVLHETIQIPAIAPYESHKISTELNENEYESKRFEYEVVIPSSPSGRWQLVDVADKAVEFAGGWKLNPDSDEQCFMNSEMVATAVGDSVIFTFEGTRAKVFGQIGRSHGKLDAYVDGVFLETFGCQYSERFHEKFFQTPLIPHGKHTLKLVKSSQKSTGRIAIDSFAFEAKENDLSETLKHVKKVTK